MENTVFSFGAHVAPGVIAWIQASKYILLFFGCIFEGPVVMVASGFLYRIGGFELLPMYLVLVSGDFVADMVWYCVGRYGARNIVFRYGSRFGITPRNIEKIQKRFERYHDKILIISKLTMGFGFAVVVLVVAGMSHVPFKRYATLNLFGGFIWTGLLVTLGYFFGNVFASITGPEKIVFMIFGFLAFIGVIQFLNHYLARIEA